MSNSTTISSTFQKASEVATTVVAEATGFAALGESYDQPAASTSEKVQPGTEASEEPASATSNLQLDEGQKDDETAGSQEETRNGEQKEEQPQQQRKESTQKPTGTQTDIKTPAGAGTTVSADDDVQAALAKERGQPQPQLPQDNEPVQESHTNEPSSQTSHAQEKPDTGSGIQTSAGVGTTVSPDDDVKAAFVKERENHGQSQPGRSDANEATQNSKESTQGSGIPTAAGDGTTLSPDDDVQAATAQNPSKLQHQDTPSSSEHSNSTADAPATEVSEDNTAGSDKSKVGWRTKLKGQAKVISGKIAQNEEKVGLGREIKAGHH